MKCQKIIRYSILKCGFDIFLFKYNKKEMKYNYKFDKFLYA